MTRLRRRTGDVSPVKSSVVLNTDESAEDEKYKIWQLFVEEYHDLVTELPLEFQRSFSLLRDLEDAQQASSAQLRRALLSYLSDPDRSTNGHVQQRHPTPGSSHGAQSGPSARVRDLLSIISDSSRAAVRAGEDKVNLCRALYENVDRQIQVLDASLARYEDSLVLGLRENTLPSHEAPSLTRKEAPGRTTNRAARALEHPMSTTLKKGGSRAQQQQSLAMLDDWTTIDPNEPTYCLCERVSFGEMIACENEDCPREWFHLECVGLAQAPVGTWYCPECAPLFEKKESKKHRIEERSPSPKKSHKKKKK